MSSTSHSTPTTPLAVNAPPAVPMEPSRKRWTRAEYHRLGEEGWFRNQRVELIDGEIIEMSPQSPQHYNSQERIRRCLQSVFGDQYLIRLQGPVIHGDHNEPEPDLCVVKGQLEDYDQQHPSDACLVVEVSKSSLRYDTTTKQSLYASMAVPDYWVLDLENRQLLVHRQPIADEQTQFGHRYESVETVAADGHVSPLEKPNAKLAVAEMLPPAKSAGTAAS